MNFRLMGLIAAESNSLYLYIQVAISKLKHHHLLCNLEGRNVNTI